MCLNQNRMCGPEAEETQELGLEYMGESRRRGEQRLDSEAGIPTL